MSASETFRQRLAAEMERQGMSQRALAEIAGTTQANISRVLSGDQDATISYAERLTSALDVELWKMLKP